MDWYLIYMQDSAERGWYLCSWWLYESMFPVRSFNLQLVSETTGWTV